MWGIEPQTFHMQSERSTTELHPRLIVFVKWAPNLMPFGKCGLYLRLSLKVYCQKWDSNPRLENQTAT